MQGVSQENERERSVAEIDRSPKYDVTVVEAVILLLGAELHPQHLTVNELTLEIVSDVNDPKEVETISHAIDSLKSSDLLSRRDDEIVEPTRAALRACALLA